MLFTKNTVADKINDYIQHQDTLAELVEWPETTLMEGEFDEQEMDALRSVISRLGVADVQAFGLTWEDFQEILKELGYSARVEVVVI